MNVTMKDRVAVITGGSKGIGLACARRFAESGYITGTAINVDGGRSPVV